MKQKIEWYREVLELEPGSKIFFPLAQMLAKDNRADEAVAVLRQGIARHSDHMEARFLLVELLFRQGDKQELRREVDAVSALLGGYPGFWQAWGERLGADPATRDAGLAVIFLAAHMRRESFSWADIIASGLKGLLGENGFSPSAVPAVAPMDADGTQAPEELPGIAASAAIIAQLPAVVAENSVCDEEAGNGAPDCTADDEDGEEPFSLRTRSMAEVLAEQGDMAGALEIYQELFDAAPGDTEKTALSSRMAELKQGLESGSSVQDKSAEDAKGATAKSRLSDMLEALAQRLEARSLQ